jgi:hypothetical protein
MPTQITINNLSGASPYDIYLCDDPISTCVYITTTSTLPYVFDVPSIMESQTSFNLKMIDNNGCEVTQNLTT